jgi:hypothetical protein
VAELTPLQRDLQRLEADLKRLETEYTLYFAERSPRPPAALRSRVEKLIQRLTGPFESNVDRFRFETLQARFHTFASMWDRGVRAREEGRPGPLGKVGE